VLYRFTKAGARIAVDLEGIHQGGTLFLLGGSPQLKSLLLDLLTQPGVFTLALNNVPLVFPRPTFWLGADRAECFSPHVWALDYLKFSPLSRREVVIPGAGQACREAPGALFFGTTDFPPLDNFLDHRGTFGWYRSVFPLGLQLAHYLGFRRVLLVGCGFDNSLTASERYAWPTDLTKDQAAYSQATYDRDVERLRQLVPVFKRGGFEVVSCTPVSQANDVLPYKKLVDAVAEALLDAPPQASPSDLVHSSRLQEKRMNADSPTPTAPDQPEQWDLTEDEAGLLETAQALAAQLQDQARRLEEAAAQERRVAQRHLGLWIRALCRGRGQDFARLQVKITGPRSVVVSPLPATKTPQEVTK